MSREHSDLRATTIVHNQGNGLLLVKYHGESGWALPGGSIVAGEDPAECAAIEVEETAEVEITQPVFVTLYDGDVDYHQVFLAEGFGEPMPNHEEIEDAIWWDEVQPLPLQPHVTAILDVFLSLPVPGSEEEPPVAQPLVEHTPIWISVIATVWTWAAVAALFIADCLIWVMLITRSGERRIQPTKRVTWPKGLKQELMKRQDNTCVYCGHRRIARNFEIDHMIPVIQGGSNDIRNLQVICSFCNRSKGIQTDREFRERYSRLGVPRTPLTPPKRVISEAEFKKETQRTSQADSVAEFRRTRYISPREKILTGSFITGCVVAGLVVWGLGSIGAAGLFLSVPALVLGVAAGFGIWLRAYTTGATARD